MGMQYGFLSEFVLKEHALVSVAMVLICGLGSFVAFLDHLEDLRKIEQRRFCDQNSDVRVWLLCAVNAYIVGNTRPVRPCIRDFFLKNSIGYLLFSDQKNKYNDLCIKD